MTGETGTCPVCGRVLGVYVPAGGDGSLVVMRRHRDPVIGLPCRGSRKPAEGTP